METATARHALEGMYAGVAGARGRVGLAELTGLLTGMQGLRCVLDALEVEVLAQVGAIEVVAVEDGTLAEVFHEVGHQELDAPEVVAPCLGVTVHAAATRMSGALALLTRTPALVAAMAAGELDGYRAKVVSDELADAPVAAAVVAELVAHAERVGGWFEPAGRLRRRTVATLARIDEAVLAARAARVRTRRGLTRGVEEVGLDRWEGFYPVQESRLAWEAIDQVARQLLAAGAADTLTQARADAHLQLLLGQVTATIHLHPTTAGDATSPGAADDPTSDDDGDGGGADTTGGTDAMPDRSAADEDSAGDGPSTGAAADATNDGDGGGADTTGGADCGREGSAAADGPMSAARGSSGAGVVGVGPIHPIDPVHPASPGTDTNATRGAHAGAGVDPDASHAVEEGLVSGHGLEVGGYGGLEWAFLEGDWLAAAVAAGRVRLEDPVACDPSTGAVRDVPDAYPDAVRGKPSRTSETTRLESGDGPGHRVAEQRYRPSARLRAVVALRDGTCRFPGCQVRAKYCDLDHVRPWPVGPTAAWNLMVLCRRHHRVKQRPGWRVQLFPDGRVRWFFPDGRQVVTDPVDHLAATRPLVTTEAITVAAATAAATQESPARPGTRIELPDLPYDLADHSPLVEHYTRLLGPHRRLHGTTTATTRAGRHARAATPTTTTPARPARPAPRIQIGEYTASTHLRHQTHSTQGHLWDLWIHLDSLDDAPF